MAKLSLRAVQKLTCKKRDAWWTVFLVDPVATRMLIVLARFRFITPNRVTWAALFIGLASAGFFLLGDSRSLLIGALLYHLSFILDCIDGKLARLKGNGTVFGGWLDYVFDRIRVLFCALALMGGQFLRTGGELYLLAALAVVFLDMLRYVDALQIYKMRMSMRTKIEKVTRERAEAEREEAEREARATEAPDTARGQQVVFMEDLLRDNPATPAETLRAEAGAETVIDLHEQFRGQFPWYTRLRRAMLRTRVRPHLISGIEFQMFVFIVGPLIGQILWTTAVSAALLMLFELVIMYKFWLSTRDFTRVMEELAPAPSTAGTIAPHLHRGRHRQRGAAQEALLADERYRTPEPEDDPGFQPYPQPRYDRLDPRETYDAQTAWGTTGGYDPHGFPTHGTATLGHPAPAVTQPIPVQRVDAPWPHQEGHRR
ncbi:MULTISPECIES: CDP-alcohol phosphatidyltransferase family protein [Streptomyces]|uniref:CDP-alcohol phosphatidyltransferase family protein n=1 Tax=Streptomyces vinaceusdrappus TaxID=67376 RepID=A0ABY6C057_9ACTN|nr:MULTISPECIES: CDP-alcohol phosphatidyltransferase family protein [Streptomyces]UXI81357.1 CDP-alcohol phosphatidyltransferase family protein [Streptomyces vinaceusdrappus]